MCLFRSPVYHCSLFLFFVLRPLLHLRAFTGEGASWFPIRTSFSRGLGDQVDLLFSKKCTPEICHAGGDVEIAVAVQDPW